MIYEDQLAAVKRDSAKHGTTGSGEIDLALLTDGLKAEREQGITIDVAYRYFSTDKRKFIIADTPGHEQYTRNMATGASTCQLAIILIDARHGVMTQTRRHSFIVSLLGIKHVVVAINKMDLVGYSPGDRSSRSRTTTPASSPSSTSRRAVHPDLGAQGDNVVDKSPHMPWYQGPPLLRHLETVHIASDRNLADLRFPVQYVLRPNLDFRGFSGTIASGIVRKGDEVRRPAVGQDAAGSSRSSPTTASSTRPSPRMAVTVTLEDEIDVSRGDMLVHPGNAAARLGAGRGDGRLDGRKAVRPRQSLLDQADDAAPSPARSPSSATASTSTRSSSGRPRQLAMNEVGHVLLSLNQPIAYDAVQGQPRDRRVHRHRPPDQQHGRRRHDPRAAATAAARRRPLGPGADRRHSSSRSASEITLAEREARLGQKGATVLLYGLTGSGKATIAYALEKRLFDAGRAVTVLYGPNMRQGLCRDLGFTADDRSENLRRSRRSRQAPQRRRPDLHLRLRRPARSGPREGPAGRRRRPLPRASTSPPRSRSAANATRPAATSSPTPARSTQFPGVSAATNPRPTPTSSCRRTRSRSNRASIGSWRC